MTWPLPLTVIEKLLLAEDRPGYSWSVFFRLRFSKRLNDAAVRAAVLAVLPRHPLLCSLVRRTFLGGGQWIEAENKTPLFESVPRVDGREYPPAKHLDLTKEIGIRVVLVSDDHSSDVIFQIHHAVLDGKGMIGFLQDWLFAYAREIGFAPTDLNFTPLDESLLPQRGRLGLTFGRVLCMIRRQLVGLKGVKQFLSNKPTPLLPHIARPSQELANNQFPAVRLRYFTVEETLGTIRAAKKRGVSVNDLLIRDLLSAIFSLQKNHGVYVEDNVIRLMIPMDMRRPGDERMSAANVVSSIFIDRCGRQGEDSDHLLQSIHDEMQAIKRNELGFTFIFSLKLGDGLPGRIAGTVRGEKCRISSILTNVGQVLGDGPLPRDHGRIVVGDAILEHFEFVAPLRPYLVATFAVATYAGQIRITMQFNADALSDAQADALIQNLVAAVRATGK